MNFDSISPNGSVDGYVLLKTVEKKTSAKGGFYLDATISNKTGEMNAKLWDYSEAVHGAYESGNLVKVRGTISEYRSGLSVFALYYLKITLILTILYPPWAFRKRICGRRFMIPQTPFRMPI